MMLGRVASRHDLPEYETARDAFWVARFGLGARVLEQARARGELRDDVDPRVALETLVGPLSLRSLLTREAADDDFVADVVDLVLRGLARPT